MSNQDYPMPAVRPPSKKPATFLVDVDHLVSKYWSDADWRRLLDAASNQTSITGKWEVDRGFAAKRLQDEAVKTGLVTVATAKISKIMRAIETLLRRDGLGRRQRLQALSGPTQQPAE